ncbi:MAG TPA: hypothetical protein VN045_07900, partial [Microbacteriaceae bacterium]|nr:hypothetical protein [Microbacteriaceae bacterium]
MIQRPRLHDRLDAEVPLRLLRAPIGFGKTTLVQQWLDARDTRDEVVATVRVRPGGGDADSFWVAVTEALVDAGLPLPTLSQNRSWQSLAERMITAARVPLLLWIDNFENVTADSADHVLLDLLVHTPNVQLVVSLRGHRHFADHLLGDLDSMTVTPKELLFTPNETGQLLRMAGLELSQSDIDDMHEASGGWPEPTRTFALALTSTDSAQLRATGSQVAADWLQHRLLPEGTEAELVEFAMSTTLPDELTVGLAEALSEDPSAKLHLETLSEYGVLFRDLRQGEPVFRWPSAARGALHDTLVRRTPERLPELHARLARWHLDHEQSVDALRCAVKAGDSRLVVQVIERAWRELLMYHHQDLHDALVCVPVEHMVSSDRAMAVRDIWLGGSDDRLLASASLPSDDVALNKLARGTRVRDVLDTGLAVMTALRRRGRFDLASAQAEQLLKIAAIARDQRPEQTAELVPSVQLSAGQTLLLTGDFRESMPALHRAYDWSADSTFDYIEPDAAASLALSHAVDGRTDITESWLARYASSPQTSTWMEVGIRGKASAAQLLLALDRLDLDAARMHARSDPLDERLGMQEWWAFRIYAQARHALHTGTALDALDTVDGARTRFHAWIEHSAAGPLLAAAETDL